MGGGEHRQNNWEVPSGDKLLAVETMGQPTSQECNVWSAGLQFQVVGKTAAARKSNEAPPRKSAKTHGASLGFIVGSNPRFQENRSRSLPGSRWRGEGEGKHKMKLCTRHNWVKQKQQNETFVNIEKRSSQTNKFSFKCTVALAVL